MIFFFTFITRSKAKVLNLKNNLKTHKKLNKHQFYKAIDLWMENNANYYKKCQEKAKSARFAVVKWPEFKNGLIFGIVRIDIPRSNNK